MGIDVKPSLEWVVSGGMGFLVGIATHVSDEGSLRVSTDTPQSLLMPLSLGYFISFCYPSKSSIMKLVRNTSACTVGYMAGAMAATAIVNFLKY